MSMKQVLLSDVAEQMRPGDIIAFSGKTRFSRLIRLATRSIVSHVGIIHAAGRSVDLIESVTFEQDCITGEDIDGVWLNHIKKRVDNYAGMIWWLPLNEAARFRLNQKKMIDFLKTTYGKSYDMPQAIKAVVDLIEENPFFDLSTYNHEDFDAFFCSELATAALRAGEVIDQINPSEVTPVNLCSFNIFSDDYYQLRGRRKELDEFNTLDPEGFGIR